MKSLDCCLFRLVFRSISSPLDTAKLTEVNVVVVVVVVVMDVEVLSEFEGGEDEDLDDDE